MNHVFEMFFHGENGERTKAFPYFEGFHFETKVYETIPSFTQPDSEDESAEFESYLISWYVNCIKPASKKDDGEKDTVKLMDTGNMTQVWGQKYFLTVFRPFRWPKLTQKGHVGSSNRISDLGYPRIWYFVYDGL